MRTTPHDDQSDAQPGGYDDLTAIKGIGETTQAWLRKNLNVRRYSDLTALSAGDVEERMKAEGRIISRGKIDTWIAQAQELAASAAADQSAADPDESEAAGRRIWKTIATFVVVFEGQEIEGQLIVRSEAHHMEADRTQHWTGVQPAELGRWIIAQLGEHVIAAVQPAETNQVIYSPRLQQHLATLNRLSGTKAPDIPETAERPAAAPWLPQSETAAAQASSPGELGLYSQRLQEVIAKARRLGGENR